MKPLVSILIPAFNAQSWISDTIRSALGQTWANKEVIVVDDGSTDETRSIAQRFSSSELKVVTQENQGAAAARNKAFSLCQGDYIQWLDADDLLAPDKVARQVAVLGHGFSPRTLLSAGWGRFIYRLERTEFLRTGLWCDLSPVDWLIRKMKDNLHMQTATWLVSRDLCEAAGPWDTRLLGDDDGEYFCRVLLSSDWVKFVPEARIYYRISGYGRLSYIGTSDRKLEAQFLSMQKHVRYLRSLEESERVRAACVKYLQNWLINFYPNRPDLVEQLQQLASDLGGRLESPALSWKYEWVRRLFGWNTAKQALVMLPMVRWSCLRAWDRSMYRLRMLVGERAVDQRLLEASGK
jgi:glycosyltransferase involved in cell wall biosynthesis